jgi:hypothetical protein
MNFQKPIYLILILTHLISCTEEKKNLKQEYVYRNVNLKITEDSAKVSPYDIDTSFMYIINFKTDTVVLKQKNGTLRVPVIEDSIKSIELRYKNIRITQSDIVFLQNSKKCFYSNKSQNLLLHIINNPKKHFGFDKKKKIKWVAMTSFGCDIWNCEYEE